MASKRKVKSQKIRRFADGGAIIGWDDNGPIYDYSQVSSVNSGLTPGDIGYVAPAPVYLSGDPTEPSNYYTPPVVAAAPVAQTAPLPTNIAAQEDAVAAYTGLLSSGYSDAEIRAAADQIYGKQSDADWAYLQDLSKPAVNVPTGLAPGDVGYPEPTYVPPVAEAQEESQQTLDLTEDTSDKDVAVDYRGNKYDTETLLNVASQIAPNIGNLQGGVYGEQNASVGFDYNEAKRILGQDPTAQEQVILDMARNLIDQGVTDLGQLEVKDIEQDYRAYQVYDEFGNPTGQWQVNVPTGIEGESTSRILTPEEVEQITSERFQDLDYDEVRYTANDILSGRGLFAGEDLITQTNNLTDALTLDLGATYSGPGNTKYKLVANPATGALQFNTVAESSSNLGEIQSALTVLSFVPGVNVVAALANAAISASQGNYIAALAQVAGATGLNEVSTALRVGQAIENGDVTTLASALMSNPSISGQVGSTMLTDTISLSDAVNAGRVAFALSNGDYVGAARAAGSLVDSPDAKTAAAAASVLAAASTGNIGAIANATKILANTANATQNLNNSDVAKTVIQKAGEEEGVDPYSEDVGLNTYIAAKNAGATDEEALNASNAVTGALNITSTFEVNGKTLGDDFSNAQIVDGAEGTADDQIASTKTFSEAFRDARAELGPGKTFTWNGQQYSTNTREEDPALAAASDKVTGAAATGALSGGMDMPGADTSVDAAVKAIEGEPPASGSDRLVIDVEEVMKRQKDLGGTGDVSGTPYEDYNVADVSNEINKIDLSKVLPAADQQEEAADPEAQLILGSKGEKPIPFSKDVKENVIEPALKAVGFAARAGGDFTASILGGLAAVEIIAPDSPLIKMAQDVEKWGAEQLGPELLQAEKNVYNKIEEAGKTARIQAEAKLKELESWVPPTLPEDWESLDPEALAILSGQMQKPVVNVDLDVAKAQAKAAAIGMIENPTTLLTMGAHEVVQELPAILSGVGFAKLGYKALAYGTDFLLNALEGGGANYLSTQEALEKSGETDPEKIHEASQKSAAGMAIVQGVLGTLTDVPFIKSAAETTTKTTASAAGAIGRAGGESTGPSG